jgi:pimeloyl-ACP methyl ester carboxylesterase
VTLPGSGHCPNIEQAPRVTELLLDFFQRAG